ncbi:MAG TPA: hypothetical protein VG015_05205, partial [Candidatus Dormibacteraeota bacterium]|nr:hypothetical protein [Candidatus Dormibacteraeota bacterium]
MESPLTPGPPTAIPSLNPRSKIGPTRIRAVAGVVVALVVATSFSLDWARAGVATLASAPVASMLAASTPTWQPVGTPGAVFTNYPGFSGTGWPGYSGRVQSIAADPTHPKTLYAGMAGGGVEKTVDGGETWTTLT